LIKKFDDFLAQIPQKIDFASYSPQIFFKRFPHVAEQFAPNWHFEFSFAFNFQSFSFF